MSSASVYPGAVSGVRPNLYTRTSNELIGLVTGDTLALLANDNTKLDFVVQLRALGRDLYVPYKQQRMGISEPQ